MHCFKHSNGTVFSFAFDPINKLPAPDRVFFSDTDGETWEPSASNLAGNITHLECSSVFQVHEIGGATVAWSGNNVLVFRFIGSPYVWMLEARKGLPDDLAQELGSNAQYLYDLAKGMSPRIRFSA